MLLLMDPRSFYGLAFHEWAGLIIGIFFILESYAYKFFFYYACTVRHSSWIALELGTADVTH